MKFAVKNKELEAVQFVNTPEGIAELQAFCGSRYEGIRDITTRTGLVVAIVDGSVVPESFFVVKRGGNLFVVKPGVLSLFYAAIVEQPKPAAVVAAPLTNTERREAARAAGETRYMPDYPCMHGHHAERYVSSNTCVECASLSSKAQVAREQAARVVSLPAWAAPLRAGMMQ